MPVVVVKMVKGRPVGKKRVLVKAVTEAVVNAIDVRPEWVTVILDEYPRENWASDGKLHSDRFGKGCGKQGVPGTGTVQHKRRVHA